MTEAKREMEKKQSVKRLIRLPSFLNLFPTNIRLTEKVKKKIVQRLPTYQLPLMLSFYTTMAQLSRTGPNTAIVAT